MSLLAKHHSSSQVRVLGLAHIGSLLMESLLLPLPLSLLVLSHSLTLSQIQK